MSDGRPGLDFSEAKKRVSRIMTNPGHPQAKCNLVNSIINQATMREGKKAHYELTKIAESSSLSGRGTKQTGFGPGHKWTESEYIANGYKEVAPGKWRKTHG